MSSSANIQPLHRNPAPSQGNLQRKLFQRNFGGAQGAFASPTDNMLSPCSQKLNAHKNRFFANTKATKLNFSNLEDDK
ncbi:hypothetical protein WICANDRAFT_63534 [Wickerhamomyces anomalus NRRL Y-366-8]|uniref:Uncharacterized protein n=1 Tax=Wickerhamomyces anomalus (strain ATCC 58044 / CBS 1984 / NCYC 433 / NRRL Y-366-8) TaxID=683960 RepID=A0A1E3P1G5_WICAA|nr:uncharacterized protein WICANDRAFT_63534 [Wickerhamomyces anomalus NRRL Y-366-8]ODQ59034.1 hypothetical protein WICANDRAFT_63534 [Wickerhamomyces anomalus NRRL Y-366-8]